MGIEGTNSNGHGEGKEENMNMIETIKKFCKRMSKVKKLIMKGL
jgi:hypothetical protein